MLQNLLEKLGLGSNKKDTNETHGMIYREEEKKDGKEKKADRNSFTYSFGMEFVLIPAGEFDMGSPSNEVDRNDNEGPVHHVKISNAFYMGKYEITQKQWREIMRTDLFSWDEIPGNDSQRLIEFLQKEFGVSCVENANVEKIDNIWIRVTSEKNRLSLRLDNEKMNVTLKIDDGRSTNLMAISENGKLNIFTGNIPSISKDDNLPVVQVSWNDVQDFIKKLNEKEKTNKYRLPTEAEWEYAARAGTTTRYSFGDDDSILGDYAWYSSNSGSKTHDVGQKKPNPWGLYDMHGNVWEWVQDKYHSYEFAPFDGSAWESGSGSFRVSRGGLCVIGAGLCRSARRTYYDPGVRAGFLGFRLLRIL